MMNKLFSYEKFWNNVLKTGCGSDLSALDTIRIQVVNGAAILLTLSQVIIISLRLIYGEAYDITYILNLLIGLIVFPVFYFNKHKQHFTAKSLFFVSALLLITFICWNHASSGRITNTELILVPCSIFSILLFDGALKHLTFLAIFLCYIFIVIVRVQTQRIGAELTRDDLINPILAFTTVFVLTNLYRIAYDKLQKLVLAKNVELNQQKNQIEAQSRKLQELNEQKDKLFSIISHDLRNPLNSMNSLILLMAKDWITEQDFKQQLPGLSRSLMATSDLLNNLLFWSRSQLKGEVHQFSHFEITLLVKSVITSVEGQAQQKGIRIQNLVNEVTVYADMDMMTIVLRNLVTNAIKFSQTGQLISISSSSSEEFLELRVRDTGMGIKPEELKGIFDFRFKSTQGTMNEKGTGLGLTLCRDFVEKNGGKIWAESEIGKGSTFYLTIPLNQR